MQALDSASLTALAERYGLGESYHDYRGEFRRFSDAARQAILRAMGAFDTQTSAPGVDVYVRTTQELFCDLPLSPLPADAEVQLHIVTEVGHTWQEKYSTQQLQRLSDAMYRVPLPQQLPLGYHRLVVRVAGVQQVAGALIITPPHCHVPAALKQGRRWGLSIQLYTLRSPSNWGIGDFADLKALIRQAAAQGCATIGLNPLHALRPADAARISPYSPSHRSFLNLLYIAVVDVPEFAHCRAAQKLFASSQTRLQAARDTTAVDYLAVSKLKLPILRMLYAEFARTQLAQETPRAQLFRRYVEQQGRALHLHALYDVLDQYFSTQPDRHWGWRSWPSEYQHPERDEVHSFAAQRAKAVECYMYLQWLAATQLSEAQQLAREQGMALGLYADLAVGVDPDGSEVWGNQELFVADISVGAPPDPLALKGQDWGIPPLHPQQLQRQAYQPFIHMLRANMQFSGALRIDHVMTLCRLWWVPRGFSATDGVYVHYPLNDLMKLVALESERNQCLVVGEDLGTVPDAMRHAMERFGMYHYKVLFFEKQGERFIAPQDYLHNALAVVTTHDLPPLKSWWQGEDIELRARLQLYPDEAVHAQVQQEREQDRRQLMQALVSAGLWGWQAHEAVPAYSLALMRAVYLYANLSRAALAVVQPEDLQAMSEPVNVPGTSHEHANWQRKLQTDLCSTLQQTEIQEIMQALNRARRGEHPN